MAQKRTRLQIYSSRLHVLATGLIVLIPFVFFLFFAKLEGLSFPALLGDIGSSLLRILAAYIISAFLGWTAATLFFRGRHASVALPVFDVLQSIPTFSILPLATVYLGRSNSTIIIFLVAAIIWPIFFSVVSSLRLIRNDWEEAVEILSLKGFDYVRYFLYPASLTGLITGSIIGLGDGWEALIATEIITQVRSGLGNFFEKFSGNPTVTTFGVLGFLIIIFSINKLIWLPLLDWSHRKLEE